MFAAVNPWEISATRLLLVSAKRRRFLGTRFVLVVQFSFFMLHHPDLCFASLSHALFGRRLCMNAPNGRMQLQPYASSAACESAEIVTSCVMFFVGTLRNHGARNRPRSASADGMIMFFFFFCSFHRFYFVHARPSPGWLACFLCSC